MNDFDRKWQECAARARQAPGRDERAPFGFAARVQALAGRGGSVSMEQVLMRLTWRCLAGVAAVFLVFAAMELPHLFNRSPLEPGIENTVAQVVWSI